MTEITRYEYVICFASIGETSLRHVKNTASCATPLTWTVTNFTTHIVTLWQDFRPAISVFQFLGHRVILISKQPAVPEFGYAGLPKTAKPRSTSSGLFLPPVV